MMDFPASPTNGQTFTGPNGILWTYDGTKWVAAFGIPATATATLGLANNLTDTLPLGTYDLGPVTQGGTILSGYAHRVSGTLTYGAAIGQPGTYTDVTGLTALAITSATDIVTAASGATAVVAPGAHVYIKVTGTAAVGAVAFLTLKVP